MFSRYVQLYNVLGFLINLNFVFQHISSFQLSLTYFDCSIFNISFTLNRLYFHLLQNITTSILHSFFREVGNLSLRESSMVSISFRGEQILPDF